MPHQEHIKGRTGLSYKIDYTKIKICPSCGKQVTYGRNGFAFHFNKQMKFCKGSGKFLSVVGENAVLIVDGNTYHIIISSLEVSQDYAVSYDRYIPTRQKVVIEGYLD